MLEAQAAKAMLSATSVPWEGALYSLNDGVAEPRLATAAIAQLARRNGCRILEHCAIRGLQCDGSRVTGVVTERGAVQAGSVQLAGGACPNIGIQVSPHHGRPTYRSAQT